MTRKPPDLMTVAQAAEYLSANARQWPKIKPRILWAIRAILQNLRILFDFRLRYHPIRV
jgi:hypothetical protein